MSLLVQPNQPKSSHFWMQAKALVTTTKGANKVIKVLLKIYDIAEYIFKKEVLERFNPAKKHLKNFKEFYSATRIIDKLGFWVCAEDKTNPKKANPAWLNSATSAYKIGSKFFILLAALCKVVKFLDGTLIQLGKIAEGYSEIPVLGFIVSYPLKIYRKIFKFFSHALSIVDEQLKAHKERKKITLAKKKIIELNNEKEALKKIDELARKLITTSLSENTKIVPQLIDSMGTKRPLNSIQEVHLMAEQIIARERGLVFDKGLSNPKETQKKSSVDPLSCLIGDTPYPDTYAKLYDIQPSENQSTQTEFLTNLTEKTAWPFFELTEEEQIKPLGLKKNLECMQEEIGESVDLLQHDILNMFDELDKRNKILPPINNSIPPPINKVPSLISSLHDSENPSNVSFPSSASMENFTTGTIIIEGECGPEPQLDSFSSAHELSRDVATIDKEIDRWEFKLFKAERRYTDTKLTTVYRVAKMAHALFSTIALLTGFGGLPFFAISLTVKVAVRGLGYAKTWWRKTRPTTEESFRAFKIAREAIKSSSIPAQLAVA